MKSHAVPQEIMAMEFKLFGNFMTMREFIYIAAGIAIAWFFYLLMGAGVIPALLAWPAVILFGLGGVLFGLVPVQDRSLDQWLVNFILAIRKPTKRIWKKPGFEPVTDSEKEIVSLKSKVISPMKSKSKNTKKKIATQQEKVTEQQVDREVEESLNKIDNTISQVEKGLAPVQRPVAPLKPQVQQQTVQPQPVPQPVSQPSLQQKTVVLKPKVQQPKPAPNQYEPQMIKPETKPQQPAPREEIEQFIPKKEPQPEKPISKKLSDLPDSPTPVAPSKTIEITNSNVQQYLSKDTIPNLKQYKNTINIIVKDSAGKIIDNVVTVIKDVNGSPIRAAVSNEFGQIINNNPLDNGRYKVTLSKEGYTFPDLDVEMKGKNYPILEITAQ